MNTAKLELLRNYVVLTPVSATVPLCVGSEYFVYHSALTMLYIQRILLAATRGSAPTMWSVKASGCGTLMALRSPTPTGKAGSQ